MDLGNMSSRNGHKEALEDQKKARKEIQSEKAAQQSAHQMLSKQMDEVYENPEFLDKLQDPDVDRSELHNWIEDEFGPLLSGAHIIANRSSGYERERKWLNENKGERIIAERNPGRLCKGPIKRIAQKIHRRTDKEPLYEFTQDEKRIVRDSMDVVTNRQSLSIGARALKAITEATAVSKVEKNEEKETGLRGKLKKMYK